MPHVDAAAWQHRHDFAGDHSHAERRTHLIIAITAAMMIVEIIAGAVFHSMALLADGWHMGTHVAAFAITALAYWLSRRNAANPRYTFGTAKIGVLGGFASAVVLAVVALLMAVESAHRLFHPLPIQFGQAITIAAVGLVVNIVCALLLEDDHPHGPHHDHPPRDLNLHSAYVHVLADALTSLTAIAALLAGMFLGWAWLDAAMGIAGSVVISVWAYGLIRDTSGVLLDRAPAASDLLEVIPETIEADGDSVVYDLHVWPVGPGQFAAIVGIVAHAPRSVKDYRQLLRRHEELVHVTIEIQPRADPGSLPA